MSKFIPLWATFIVIIILFGCSESVKKESSVDTPKNHYKIGMQKLEMKDLKTAETEFLRAVELDKDSPMGYTGLAFIELSRSNYKIALKHANKAIKKDLNFIDAYIAKGQIITSHKHGNKWFTEALKPFKKALSLEPENEKALFYLADCYDKAEKYEQALEYYSKTSAINGAFAEQVNKRIAFIKKMMQVEPLSDKGKIIARRDKINRADLCILLIEELKLKNLLKSNRPELFEKIFRENFTLRTKKVNVKSEVENNKSKEWILEIIQIDIPFLDFYPDGNFYPDRLVTKSLFSIIIQGVLVLVTDNPTLSTKYTGLDSQFNDIHPDYYAFNAINLCIEKGIMDFPENGDFNPENTISGIDAILMLKAVEDILGN